MFSKTLLVYLVVYFSSNFAYGQQHKKFFREDYSYLETTEGFYKIHTSRQTWAEAKQVCALEGASFFYPDNRDEANAVISFWKSTQPDVAWAFVGLSDILSEGVFVTVDGKSLYGVYNQWLPGEPNDLDGNENCVVLSIKGGLNDIPCYVKSYFICKKSHYNMFKAPSGPPIGFKGSARSSSEIITQWQPPLEEHRNGHILGYIIRYRLRGYNSPWTEQKITNEAQRNYLIQDLITWKEYNVQIAAYNDKGVGVFSDSIMIKTIEGVPEAPPNSVRCEPFNSTALTVWWTPPNPQKINGINRGYKMQAWIWDEKEGANVERKLVKVPPNLLDSLTEQSAVISGLEKFTEYNITVLCFTEPGDGPRSDYVQIRTDEDNDQKNQASFRKDYTYIEAGESFYKIHTTKKNWRDAKRECALEGASLFYPENSDEANAVISFWKQYQNNTVPSNTWVFVGISDIITEGVYETIDGKSISEVYNNWYSSQPDNSGDEDCVHLNQQGNINDIKCDAKYSFICKKSFSSLERNCSCNILQSNLDGQKNRVSFRKDYTYIEAGESFYKIHTTKKNWRDAKRECALEGASLFYPENSDEANAVISFWTLYKNNTVPRSTWVFVGISDIITEGVYETIDGKSISEVYSNWCSNQPDNSGDEDCVHLNQQGNINDIKCEAEYSFICKKSLSSLERNCSCDILQSNLDEQKNRVSFRKDYTYIEAGESFYKIHMTKKNWRDAKRECALEGASLFYPENSDEANAVISFWTLYQNNTLPRSTWVFVGISDIITEGVYETIDGKSVSEVYSNWCSNQPDNSGDEDCVHLNQQGNINDIKCDAEYSFICKKSLLSLERNSSCNILQSNLDYTVNNSTGKCYKLHTTPLNWAEANAMCRIEYTTLAVISNRMEADYLANLIKSTPIPRINKQYQRGIYHLGFYNRFEEGWQTVKGTPMNLDADAWFNNDKPDRSQYEECGSMFYTGRLINTDCNTKSMFICEHEIDSSH